MANRLKGRPGYPADKPFRVTYHPDKMELPYRWKKPRKIFVCSMGDIFHEDVLAHDCFDYGIHTEGNNAVLLEIFETMNILKQHIFIVLTKRPENAKRFFAAHFGGDGYPASCRKIPKNLWLGVTAENQQAADERMPVLLDIPAAVRFVSVEPMLGKIDLSCYLESRQTGKSRISIGEGKMAGYAERYFYSNKLDWVICGGETGSKARPMYFRWAKNLKHQCVSAGIPFFFKQWGSHSPKPEEDNHAFIDAIRRIERFKQFPK
jgi:protein gp37